MQHNQYTYIAFVDYFSEDGQNIWKQGLTDLSKLVIYDGIWLDENEPTGQCPGECLALNQTKKIMSLRRFLQEETAVDSQGFDMHSWYKSAKNEDENSTYWLPFTPGSKQNLDNATISLNGTHIKGEYNLTEMDVHNLFGIS